MPSTNDLCLLQDVKNWVYGDPTDNQWQTGADAMLAGFITSASRLVLSSLNRATFLGHTVNEVRAGVGGNRMLLREYPVIGDLASLTIDGLSVSKRTTSGSIGYAGWVIENPWDGVDPGRPAVVGLDGYCFTRGVANVSITYSAGYVVQNEAQTVPASGTYAITPTAPYGRFAGDYGVTYSNGTAFQAVSSTAALSQGKYVPASAWATGAVTDASFVPQYIFSAADANASVLLNYSFTPSDVQYAVTKLVGEWSKYKTRIGQKSVSLPQGGGTAAFDLSAMPPDVVAILQQYKRTVSL